MLTLAQLDTLVALSPDDFPRAGAFAARRAIARIAQAAGADAAALPAEGAVEALERLRAEDALPIGEFYDLRHYLRRALELPLLPADLLDRVRRGEATFADAALAINRQPKLRDNGRTVGALERFAEKLALPMDRLRASPATVEPKLEEWTRATFDFTKGNFENWRSRLRKAVAFIALQERQELKLSQLTGPWFELLGHIRSPRKGERDNPRARKIRLQLSKLWPIVTYCYRNGIAPDAVSDATVQALQDELRQRGAANPLEAARNAVYAWERLREMLPGFPTQKLSRVYTAGFSKCHERDFEELSEEYPEFRASWEDYVSDFFGANGLPSSMSDYFAGDDDEVDFEAIAVGITDPVLQPRRKDGSAAKFKTVVTYAANAMLKAGETPRSIEQIPTLQNLGRVCNAIRRRQKAQGQTKARNSYLYGTATIVISMARDFDVPEEELEKMILFRDQVDPHFVKYKKGRDGKVVRVREDWRIGERHAERLKAFNDPAVVENWFAMPYLLLADAEAHVRQKKALNAELTNDVIVALIHGVMRCAPIRRANFAQLRIDGKEGHLSLPATPGTRGYIHIPPELTKTKKIGIDVELSEEVADWFRFYLKHVRPKMPEAILKNPFLIPSFSQEGYRSPEDLNRIFKDRNLKIGGFVLNMHCARHVCAKLILDQDPAKGMGLVKTLLGHKTEETTQCYYGQINTIIAQRWYQNLFHERFQERFGRAA